MSATTQDDEQLSRMTLSTISRVIEKLETERERLTSRLGDDTPPKADSKPGKLKPAAATAIWDAMIQGQQEAREKVEATRSRAPWEQPYKPARPFQERQPHRREDQAQQAARLAQELAAEVMALILAAVQRLIHGTAPQRQNPQSGQAQGQEQQAAPEQRRPWARPSMETQPDRGF